MTISAAEEVTLKEHISKLLALHERHFVELMKAQEDRHQQALKHIETLFDYHEKVHEAHEQSHTREHVLVADALKQADAQLTQRLNSNAATTSAEVAAIRDQINEIKLGMVEIAGTIKEARTERIATVTAISTDVASIHAGMTWLSRLVVGAILTAALGAIVLQIAPP